MKTLKLFTLGALAAASLESQAAVIHTSLDSRFDASVTVETVADGNLKFTVDFNNAAVDPFPGAYDTGFYTNMRLAYIQFPTTIEGNRINTSDPDKIFVETYADGVTENPLGRTYFSFRYWAGKEEPRYFTPGETDVFFIEPINETHTFDADILFAQPVHLYFDIDHVDPDHTRTIDVATVVSPAVPEPSTALLGAIAALGLIRRRR